MCERPTKMRGAYHCNVLGGEEQGVRQPPANLDSRAAEKSAVSLRSWRKILPGRCEWIGLKTVLRSDTEQFRKEDRFARRY
jgi:hypothetical protein